MSVFIETEEVLIVTVTPENQASRSYELDSGKGVFIGSALQCGVQIIGEGISPIHCRLSFDGQAIQLHDWMSGNGTFVNGQRIDPTAVLGLEDVIQIGDHVIRLSKRSKDSIGQTSQQSPLDERLGSRQRDTCNQTQPISHSLTGNKPSDLPARELPSSEPFNESVNEPTSLPISESVSEDPPSESSRSSELEEESVLNSSASSDVWSSLEFNSSVGIPDTLATPDAIEILMAEVDQLHAALGQQQSEVIDSNQHSRCINNASEYENSGFERLELRLRQLLNEAELSDQRIRTLEDLLLAAESAHRAQEEEKRYLESWMDDIEQKFSLKEQEHLAELECLRNSHELVKAEVEQLQQRLVHAASDKGAVSGLEETLSQLQRTNQELQAQLEQTRKKCRELEVELESSGSHESHELREERAKLARERAELARQRHELVNQLSVVSDENTENHADTEIACRIRALREHLREIHEQEKQEKAERSLTSRISNLWNRVSK